LAFLLVVKALFVAVFPLPAKVFYSKCGRFLRFQLPGPKKIILKIR
jgi:hypothetical protein